jgi:sugar/nucleoside kinase (ribokinase family)
MPELVVVGSVALDTIESPSGTREDILGGSATYFSTSASFFTQVHLVAVVGEDFPDKHIELLKQRKINLEGLSVSPGKTFRWSGKYLAENLNDAITLDTQLNVFADFKPVLPESYRNADLLFLANIHPALQLEVLNQVSCPKFVACDTMNLWIETEKETLKKLIKKVNLLVINEGEARLLSGEHHILKAARGVLQMGVDHLCIKRGEYGAILFQNGDIFHVPAYPLEDIHDPTGAGDTFAGGLMGALSQSLRKTNLKDEFVLRRALVHGAVMASFTVESFSLDRLKNLKETEITERYQAFKAMTHF